MATSGQVNSSTAGSGGRSYLYVKWNRTGTWNSSNCGSNIKWELWLHNGNQWYSNSIRCYEIYINGEEVSEGGTFSNYTSSGEFKLLEGTTDVPHNNDGTKTFNINFSGWFYSATNVSGDANFTLDTIPRASSFTVSGNTIGSAVNVTITRADSSFTHTVTLKLGSKTETKTSIATSTSFTPDLSQYGAQIPNSMSGSATMTVDTYKGTTKIGTTSQNITLNMPSNAKPSTPTITLTEAVAGIANKFNAYIQKKSKIHVQASSTGIYGSSIASYQVQINGTTYTSNNFTTGVLYNSGQNVCRVTVTDTRGQTSTATSNFNVLAYQEPQITKFTAERNASTPSTLNCVFSVNITNLNNRNDHSIVLKLDGANKYTDTTNYVVTNVTQNVTNVSELTTHTVSLVVSDYFTSGSPITISIPIGTGFALMNWSADGKHMAIGQVYDSNLNVDLQIRESLGVGGEKAIYKENGALKIAQSIMSLMYPVGSIYMSVNNTNPSNFFGGTWEVWGSGRVPVGINTNDTDFNTSEKTGGTKSVTLTEQQIPSHSHTGTTGNAKTTGTMRVVGAVGTDYASNHTNGYDAGSYVEIGANSDYPASAHYHTITTNTTGGGQSHTNLQPYITCYMWKRTA